MDDEVKITVTFLDNSNKFKVSIVVPEKLAGKNRENFLRKIGEAMVKLFDKDFLPNIAESFQTGDPDTVFLAKYINFFLNMAELAGLQKNDPDAPLIAPSQMFN